AVSSSTTSSPGLLGGLPEAIVVQRGFQIVSCLHWKYPKDHSVHTGGVGSDKWILLVIIL
ncbi:19747_t:CDS:2, partial [Gigaspora margarita]